MSKEGCGGGEGTSAGRWALAEVGGGMGVSHTFAQWVGTSRVIFFCLTLLRAHVASSWPVWVTSVSSAVMNYRTPLFIYVLVHTAPGPGRGKTIHSARDFSAEEFCLRFSRRVTSRKAQAERVPNCILSDFIC